MPENREALPDQRKWTIYRCPATDRTGTVDGRRTCDCPAPLEAIEVVTVDEFVRAVSATAGRQAEVLRLRIENEQLRSEHERMLSALKSVYLADKTPSYDYPGGRKRKSVVNRNGEMPGAGRRWCTPREIAWTTMQQVESRAASDEEGAL